MILGVGIDMCQISRIRKAVKNQSFLSRVFTVPEKDSLLTRTDPAPGLAASFAAKEAFAKAGGWGLAKVGLQSVWVDRSQGKPVLGTDEHADSLLQKAGCKNVHLSLSHENDFAIALVVLEG